MDRPKSTKVEKSQAKGGGGNQVTEQRTEIHNM